MLLITSCKNEVVGATKEDGLITVTKEQFQSTQMELGTLVSQDFNVTIKSSGKIDVPPQYKAKITPLLAVM